MAADDDPGEFDDLPTLETQLLPVADEEVFPARAVAEPVETVALLDLPIFEAGRARGRIEGRAEGFAIGLAEGRAAVSGEDWAMGVEAALEAMGRRLQEWKVPGWRDELELTRALIKRDA